MTAGRKTRIDQLLLARGLAESREKAQALILAGSVLVNGQKITKAGTAVDGEAAIHVTERPPFVSRGGFKLQAALDAFGIDPAGMVCLDLGASTGGFTDCLLQRGAAKVYAVDVGTGQLDWKLRTDPRVILKENVNARYLERSLIGEACDLAVCDLSFISVTMVIPVIPQMLRDGAEMVILIKPQFEVGRSDVGKGGIVRDPALHQAACSKVEAAVQALGYRTAIIDSPILGAEGNREFLLHARY